MRRLAALAWVACGLAAGVVVPASSAAAPDLQPAGLRPAPNRYPGVATTKDVAIAMRDGTKLYADVYRPARADGKPAPGRVPVILTHDPDNKNESAPVGADPRSAN